MLDLLIKNVILPDTKEIKDIGIKDGFISTIKEQITEEAATVIEAEDKIVIPGFVNLHTHLEKTLTYDKTAKNNTLEEAINISIKRFETVTEEDIEERASKALEMAIVNGTTAMRTHPVIDPTIGLAGFKAIDTVRKKYKDYIDVQIAGMFGMEMGEEGISKEGLALLEKACEAGLDVLGGAPTLCTNPFKTIDQVFDLAKAYDKLIDLHIDEMDHPSSEVLEYLAEKTIKEQFFGKVTAGHCCSLSAVSPDVAERVIKKVQEAEMSITTLPTSNTYLMGRSDSGCVRRGITRVRELLEAGVNVAYAGDNVRDPFVPFGSEDMLEEGLMLAKLLQMGTYDELGYLYKMGTYNPAKAMKLKNYGLSEGCQGDLVILDAKEIQEAYIALAAKNYVIKKGKVVAKTVKETTLF